LEAFGEMRDSLPSMVKEIAATFIPLARHYGGGMHSSQMPLAHNVKIEQLEDVSHRCLAALTPDTSTRSANETLDHLLREAPYRSKTSGAGKAGRSPGKRGVGSMSGLMRESV